MVRRRASRTEKDEEDDDQQRHLLSFHHRESNKPKQASIRAIASTVGFSKSATKNLLRKISNGEYYCGDMILSRLKKKGRNPVRTEANERRVR